MGCFACFASFLDSYANLTLWLSGGKMAAINGVHDQQAEHGLL